MSIAILVIVPCSNVSIYYDCNDYSERIIFGSEMSSSGAGWNYKVFRRVETLYTAKNKLVLSVNDPS